MKVTKDIDIVGVRKRQKQLEPDGRKIGVGISYFCENYPEIVYSLAHKRIQSFVPY